MQTVSFLVKSFNQAGFIGDAIDGALAQTYRPLEIVIADDGSTDSSVAVIRERLAKAGYCKPVFTIRQHDYTIERFVSHDRTIVLILNDHNLGNLGNWQRLCSVATGELFVKADGDDISLPERTGRIVEEWQKAGPNRGVIYHNAVKIDERGDEIGDVSKEVFERRLPLGAVMACSRKCYTEFGDIADGFAADDTVYSNRAAFLGLTVHRFDEKLVRYRFGCGISTVGASYFESLHRSVIRATRTAACKIQDWMCMKGRLPEDEYTNRLNQFREARQRIMDELPMWESSRFSDRWRSFRKTHPVFRLNSVFIIHLILLLPRFLSKPLLDFCYRMKR